MANTKAKKSKPKTKKVSTTKKPLVKKTKAKVSKTKTTKVKNPVVKNTEKTVNNIKPKINKSSEKKDLITIIVLSVLVVAIIIISLLAGNGTAPIADNTDNVNNIVDTNTTITNTETQLSQQEIIDKVNTFQIKLNKEIIENQKAIFEPWYEELGLDQDQMDSCYLENDYTNIDAVATAPILSKISTDIQLAQMLGLTGTPGIFINSYKLGGYTDYPAFKKILDVAIVEANEDFELNFDNNSYIVDSNKSPQLKVITNKNSEYTNEFTTNLITRLNTDFNDFFAPFFEKVELVELDYREPEAKELLETYKVGTIPFFFLEGNVEEVETLDKFNEYFMAFEDGYVLGVPNAENLNYDLIRSEEDHIVGDENALVTIFVFDDYDCPYCQKLDEDVLSKVREDYTEAQVNIVIKDFVVHNNSALLPAVFSRCAQRQDKYWEAHTKLLANRNLYTYTTTVQPILDKYSTEISELEELLKTVDLQ